MARADLILGLVRSAVSGDRIALRSAVEALAADERLKRHETFADKLVRSLEGSGTIGAPLSTSYSDSKHAGGLNGRDYVLETQARKQISDLVLEPDTLRIIGEVLEEHFRSELLRSYGLQPRHRLLFAGPPGNGKTSLAEAIAEALGLQFFSIRYDALIGSYLGETNQRLRSVFEYARTTPCVLLFDEFDALGKERGDAQETGEIKRVVSSLLLQIDTLPSYVIAVAATNHEELLDRAVWRRFEVRVTLPAPSFKLIVPFIERELQSSLSAKAADVVRSLHITSFAEAADFALEVRRRAILSGDTKSLEDEIRERGILWTKRLRAPIGDERS